MSMYTIDPDYRAMAVARARSDTPNVDPDAAVTAAVAYLADDTTHGYPGPLADAGWHALILASTRRYAALCDRLVGRFVHHEATTGTCWETCKGGDPCEEPADHAQPASS